MKKIILASLLSILMITSIFAASVDIGDGTETTGYIPLYGLYNNSRSHFIVPGDAITSAIDITNLEFNVSNGPSTYTTDNQIVYLKLTTSTTVATSYIADPLADGFTEIYNGSVTWDGSGWQGIQLTSPFAYDGTSNLEIIWENRDGTWSSGYPNYYRTDAIGAGSSAHSDSSFPVSDGTSRDFYPNTRVTWFLEGEPEAPTLVSPADLTTNVAIDGDLAWTNGASTTSTNLYIADNADFTDEVEVVGATSPYTTNLTYSTTYYWKVKAIGPTSIETSSSVWSFTTGIDPATPEAPTLTGPFNNYQIATLDNQLTWTNGAETTSTNLHFSINSDFTDETIVTGATSPYTPDPLWEYSTTYYWKVEAIGSTGISIFSESRNFTTIEDPNTPEEPTLVAPTNYATNQAGNTQLTWTNNDNTTSTNLTIAEDYAFTTPTEVVGVTSPYTPDPEWEYDTQYFWKVTAIGSTGVEAESDIRRFTTMEDPATPEAVTLDLPANNATNVAIAGDLTWTINGDNTDHTVLSIASDDQFANMVYSGTETSPYTTSLDNGTTYYWKVVAVGTTGIEVASSVRAFTTEFAAVTEFPWTEDFEETWVGSPSAPASWSQITISGYSPWISSTSSPHSGLKCAKAPYSYSGGQNHLLITPTFDFDASTAYRLKFWLKGSDYYDETSLTVQIASDYVDATSFTNELAYFTGGSSSNMPTTWTEQVIDLEGYSGNQNIAFRLIDDNGLTFYIDDVTIEETPQETIITMTPDVMDFGDVNIGYSATQTFTIANNGGIPATITEISVPTGFSYVSAEETFSFDLEANSSFTVDVTFTPTLVLPYSGNLTVKENTDPTNPFGVVVSYDVALTGSGIPVPQGANFDNPLILSLPAEGVIGTTEGFINDYSTDGIDIYSAYISGNDVVYEFTLEQAQLLSGTIVTTDESMGVFIVQEEPNEDTPVDVIAYYAYYSYYDYYSYEYIYTDPIEFEDEFIPAGTYYLIISSSSDDQPIDYTINVTKDDLPLPGATTSPSPANEATGQATALTLDWNNPNYTEWVEIWFGEAPEVDPDPTSRSVATRDMELLHTSTTAIEEYPVTGLDSGVTYNWKVISHNYSGSTPAEDVVTWSFTTIAEAPEAVTYTAPSNGALDRPLNGNLSWNSATGANGYKVYLSTDSSFAGLEGVDELGTTYAYSGLEYSTIYYWKVIPYNVVGSPTEGILTWSFTTMDDPTIPMPITIDFEGTTTVPATYITSTNMTVTASGHGNTSNVMYKNVWSSTTDGYIQFQQMNNITTTSVINFDYRIVDYSSPYPAISLEAGHDYFTAYVSLDNGVNFTAIDQINSLNASNLSAMARYTIDIGDYAGDTAIFRFEMDWDGVEDYWFDIDNIYFGEPIVEPAVAISTTEIDFETVIINETDSEVVTISNTGGGTLNIATIEIIGTHATEFSATTEDGASMALEAGQSLAITVEFAPESEGEKEATLQITDDMGAKYRLVNEVALSGECVDPSIAMPVIVNFDASTTMPAVITDHNMGVSSSHGNDSNGLYENIYGSYPDAYAQFQVMKNITADTELNFEYRIVAFSSYPANAQTIIADEYIKVLISTDTGANFETAYEINSTNHVVSTDFANVSIPLGDYAGQYIVVRLEAHRAAGDYYVDFDNFFFRVPPTNPIADLSVDAIDFGNVNILLADSATETVTISNVGPGTLTISEPTITGTDASLFAWEYAEETPDMALENGESLAIDVTFTPDALGVKTATLVITDDLGEAKNIRVSSASKALSKTRDANNVALTGNGWEPPQGSTCDDPLFLTLPAEGVTGTTEGFIDDYSSTWITPNSSFLNGDDVVYQFSLLQSKMLNGTITPANLGDDIGAFILQTEPNSDTAAAVILSKTSYSAALEFENELLEAGSYYLILSTYPTPQSFDFTINLRADPLPIPAAATSPSPADLDVDQATALTLEWNNADYTEYVEIWFGEAPVAETTNSRGLATRDMVSYHTSTTAIEEYEVTGLSANTTYNWKVICHNYSGETAEPVTWSFTTVGNAPEVVTYTSPADASTDKSLSGNLSWSAATGADGYNVYLSTDETFATTTPVVETTTSYAYSGLEYSTTYFWKVIPYNVVGSPTEGILTWSFTTIPDPTIATFPWTEEFTTWPAENWSQFSGILAETTPIATGSNWYHREFANIGTTDNSAYLNIYGTDNHWLVTPPINLDASVEALQLEFDIALTTYSGNTATELSTDDYVAVVISTDNGATWSNLNVLFDWANGDAISNTGDTYSTSLEGYSGIVKFGFYAERPSGSVPDINVYFDNIKVNEIPTEPILTVSTTALDFGTVYTGQTADEEVTITNEGVGTLNISNINITGDDYSYSTEAGASMALGEDESLTITVTFAPTADGVRNATLEFTDEFGAKYRLTSDAKTANVDRAVNSVTLTGTGFTPAQGSVWENPLPLSFPANVSGNTADFGDDYSSSDITGGSVSNYYINGDDVVYQFTADTDILLNGTLNGSADYLSAFILADAPNATTPAEVTHSITTGYGVYLVEYDDVLIPAGTYYLIISNYPSPQSVEYTLSLTATMIVPVPINVVMDMTADAISITWDEVELADSYNVYGCDTPDGEYTIVGNVAGEEYTATAADMMKFYKVKAVVTPVAKGFGRN